MVVEVWVRDKCVMEEGIEAKYGNDWGGWCMKKVTSAYGVSL